MHFKNNLSVCPTKHTETNSFSLDIQDNFGLFTFSKQDPKIPRFESAKKTLILSPSPVFSKSLNVKSLEIENQILSEKIKSIEIEIKNSVFEDSNMLMHQIQKTQKKIESFKEKLSHLNASQEVQRKKVEVNHFTNLDSQNKELLKEIALLKENIKVKQMTRVPKDQSLKLAAALTKLEEDQSKYLQANEELKEELESFRSLNYSKSCSLLSIEDQEKLFMIFSELRRMFSIAQKVAKGEQVRLKEFMDFPLASGKLAPVQLVAELKEVTKGLKEVISDLYADHCGNFCQIN